MFLFLSLLEDSGYMARAAFVMDRVMAALGLSGHSFVPMIVGFGCNVPAVMGARALSSRRERILTVLMMPFMSCGARLAIFSVFVSAFFKYGAMWVFMLYVLGIVAAMLTGFIVQKTLLPGKLGAIGDGIAGLSLASLIIKVALNTATFESLCHSEVVV